MAPAPKGVKLQKLCEGSCFMVGSVHSELNTKHLLSLVFVYKIAKTLKAVSFVLLSVPRCHKLPLRELFIHIFMLVAALSPRYTKLKADATKNNQGIHMGSWPDQNNQQKCAGDKMMLILASEYPNTLQFPAPNGISDPFTKTRIALVIP